jgi:hypothetical protein
MLKKGSISILVLPLMIGMGSMCEVHDRPSLVTTPYRYAFRMCRAVVPVARNGQRVLEMGCQCWEFVISCVRYTTQLVMPFVEYDLTQDSVFRVHVRLDTQGIGFFEFLLLSSFVPLGLQVIGS